MGFFLTQARSSRALADLALQTDPLTNNRYVFVAANPVNTRVRCPPGASRISATRRPSSSYTESDVWPGTGPRGIERIVRGRRGELWYTPDHYGTFRRIR
jgi:ribonuclease